MIKRTTILLLILALALVAGIAPAVRAQESTPQEEQQETTQQGPGTALDVIEADPRLNTFELLVKAAGLADNLEQTGPFTVFAPTDAAWDAFEAQGGGNGLTLTQVLLYHVVNGRYPAATVANMNSLTTLGGQSIGLHLDAQGTNFNGNGRAIGSETVASNGIVYVVDTVFQPQVNALVTSGKGSAQQDIIQVLTNNGNFGSFLTLIDAAGLTSQLQQANGNFTIFAPTDAAFAAVQSDMMNEWTADPSGALNTILSYHIITDKLDINQIANDDFLPTLEGRPLIVTTGDNKQVLINGHPITNFNVQASNGVIHVVDTVLTP